MTWKDWLGIKKQRKEKDYDDIRDYDSSSSSIRSNRLRRYQLRNQQLQVSSTLHIGVSRNEVGDWEKKKDNTSKDCKKKDNKFNLK